MTAAEAEGGAAPRRTLWALLRLAVIGALVASMIAVVRFTPLRELLDPDVLQGAVASAGLLAPVAFIVLGGLGVALWLPGTIPTMLGPILFGTTMAVPLNYLTALVGAAAGFWIARLLGGDALDRVFGGRFRLYDRYRDLLARSGFETMFYLRLVPTPFAGVSYLAGLSPMSFGTYFLATAIGILPMNILITLGAGVVLEAVMQGDPEPILSVRGAVILTLFVASLQIPRLLRWLRARHGLFGASAAADAAAAGTELRAGDGMP